MKKNVIKVVTFDVLESSYILGKVFREEGVVVFVLYEDEKGDRHCEIKSTSGNRKIGESYAYIKYVFPWLNGSPVDQTEWEWK